MMMYKIKRRKSITHFVVITLKTALLSVFIFATGYALQTGLHEYLIETLVIIIMLVFFIMIFIPQNKL